MLWSGRFSRTTNRFTRSWGSGGGSSRPASDNVTENATSPNHASPLGPVARLTRLRWSIWCAVALILAFQLFVPPIVGLSDQGDFARVIGRFGYARGDGVSHVYAYVSRKYVRDPNARTPGAEQPGPE